MMETREAAIAMEARLAWRARLDKPVSPCLSVTAWELMGNACGTCWDRAIKMKVPRKQ